MASREQARPGDIILFKNSGWLGAAIGWSEWDGGRGNYGYSHIAQVFDEAQVCEMNPPCSRLFKLSEVPWERVDLYRFKIDGVNPYADSLKLQALKTFTVPRLGMKYDYVFIAKSLGVGLLARIGFAKWARNWQNTADTSKERDVCSQWLQDNNERALSPVDLFPDSKAVNLRPSDWPLSPYLEKLPG